MGVYESTEETSQPIPIQTPSSFRGTLESPSSHHRPHTVTEVQITFRWSGPGHRVYLEYEPYSEEDDAIPTRTPMQFSRTTHEWTVQLSLPPGRYKYRFEVDGVRQHAGDQPFFMDGSQITNLITIESHYGTGSGRPRIEPPNSVPSKKYEKNFVATSPPGKYSFNLDRDLAIVCGEKPPAQLPPHLERALLNCHPINADPNQLPVPHVVMVNHMYTRPALFEKDINIFGLTRRYKEKFVTTVFYTPTTVTA